MPCLRKQPLAVQGPDLVMQFGQRRRVNEQRLLELIRHFEQTTELNLGFALFDDGWRSGLSRPNRVEHCEVAAQPKRIIQQMTEQFGAHRAFEAFYFTLRVFKKPNDGG